MLSHLDAVEIRLSASLEARVLELPDILLDLTRLFVDMFDLHVSDAPALAPALQLTFENPYLLSWRTNDEKLECLNVCGLRRRQELLLTFLLAYSIFVVNSFMSQTTKLVPPRPQPTLPLSPLERGAPTGFPRPYWALSSSSIL